MKLSIIHHPIGNWGHPHFRKPPYEEIISIICHDLDFVPPGQQHAGALDARCIRHAWSNKSPGSATEKPSDPSVSSGTWLVSFFRDCNVHYSHY